MFIIKINYILKSLSAEEFRNIFYQIRIHS